MKFKDLDSAILAVLENAYSIIERRNIYSPLKKIPSPEDPGYVSFEHSMGEVWRQRSHPQDFEGWFKEVEEIFARSGLQIAKFKMKADSYDRQTESNEPAQVFLRRITELEKIQNDIKYRETYVSKSHKPPVTLKGNVLAQGIKKYTLNEKDYENLVVFLWKGRSIVSPTGLELKKPDPLTRKMIDHKLGISPERLIQISKGIDIGSRNNDMTVKIKYPEDVFLEVTQSYR